MAQSKQEWRRIRNLGQGSFGVVELWRNSKTGKMNAVKRFEVRQTSQISNKMVEEYKKLWMKEVELMTTIDSCNFIVASEPVPEEITSSFTNKVPPILFMEYCSGGNLRSVLKLPENICGLKEKDAICVLDHVSKAIAFLHNNNIVHRDLKPDNILRYFDPNNRIIYKLSDLGFAKDVTSSQNQCTTFVGTPQYLAPEIYMGKPYDKTVDYWSFGIIAFEIMCGLRPFLHGESPANWLPLVEEKEKDVICIYRNSERKIVFSNTIPFYTHFSDVLKECLVTWLRTMLQLNPARRGRKIGSDQSSGAKESPSDVVDLKLLITTLSTKFLEIHCIKERMAFPIGETGRSTIGDIQQRISMKSVLLPQNQLLLTLDGVEALKTDNASKYLGMDLFLIPRCADFIRPKVRFPKNVNNFIMQWDSLKDPCELRKIWANAIYYLQAELRKLDIVKKSTEALRTWITVNQTNQLKTLQIDIEKAGSSLGTVLELECRLEEIEDLYGKSQAPLDDAKSGSQYWTEEMSKLHNHYKSCFETWSENFVLKPIRTTEMEELYHKILRACSDWKQSDTTSPPFSYNETLVRSICQFIVKGSDIDEALVSNIRVLLVKVESDTKLMEEMKVVVTKLKQLTCDVLQQRHFKHTVLIQKLNGMDLPSTLDSSAGAKTESEKENSPPLDNRPTVNQSPSFVRGGGIKRMCHSTLPSMKEEVKTPVMSVSLHTGLRNADQCPLVSRLMKESQILRTQTEESINSLSDSMEEIKGIIKEKDGIKWDFLE